MKLGITASTMSIIVCMILGFCHEVDENHTLLGYYAVCSGNSLPRIADETRYYRQHAAFESNKQNWRL